MKIFAACLSTETNTFSPIFPNIDDFKIVRQKDILNPGPDHMLSVLKTLSLERGDEIVFGMSAYAEPSGIVPKLVYEELRDEILEDLSNAAGVDIVLLLLHGAMVAEGYDDCEADLVSRIRNLLGPDAVVGIELDLHCHLSDEIVESADIIITFKEYPHIDINDRAVELYDLAIRARRGDVQPTMALHNCNMIGMYPTSTPSMRSFVEKMIATEQQEEVLSVSFAHGFPWGDVPYTDAKVLVITDNNPSYALRLSKQLSDQVFALRNLIGFNSLPLNEALSKALTCEGGPVVVADQSDNPGAGAPSDSTFALSWLLENNVSNVGVAIIYDPEVVRLAKNAGVGALLNISLGGKIGLTSGDSLNLNVTVVGIKEDHINRLAQVRDKPILYPLGDTVAVHCRGIDIIVSSKRSQCFSPEIFRDFGIQPERKRLLIPKSTNHFYAEFEPIASEIIYMAGPGAVTPIYTKIDYRRMPITNKFPWVENPRYRQLTLEE